MKEIEQETQLLLSNRVAHLEVSQDHQTWYHSMLGMVSYYCAVVTLTLRLAIFQIFDFKNAMSVETRLRVPEGH